MSPKVSEAHKEERRSVLLASALECFAKKGYEATTVDDIVKNAGVSKGMLYNYFPSKEAIFLELLQERTDAYFSNIRELFHAKDTASDKLRALLNYYRELPMNDARREWITIYLEFWLSSSRNDEQQRLMEARYERYVAFLAEILEEGKNSGEFREDVDSRVVAAMVWALFDGIGLHFSQIRDSRHYNRVWNEAEEALFRYLKPNA
jgi:AcrR family transcriptional regulator